MKGPLVYSAVHEIPESNAQTALHIARLSGAVAVEVFIIKSSLFKSFR